MKKARQEGLFLQDPSEIVCTCSRMTGANKDDGLKVFTMTIAITDDLHLCIMLTDEVTRSLHDKIIQYLEDWKD